MPMNRVQFQPGLSMREFLNLYGEGALRGGADCPTLAPGLRVSALRRL